MLKVNKNTNNLLSLAIAGLIAEGEFDLFSDEPILKIPIDERKICYLQNTVHEGKLHQFVKIDTGREQFIIHSHSILIYLKRQWYRGNEKIFSNILDPDLITLQSIILSMNLFGIRKLETIAIPTTIHKDFIKSISFCMERHLSVPVVPCPNLIKITNIPYVITKGVTNIPTYHSAELINFLTRKEKKQLIEGV